MIKVGVIGAGHLGKIHLSILNNTDFELVGFHDTDVSNSEKLSQEILNKHGKVDLVVSNFSFAHIDNMQDVIKGINTILKKDGVFVFEIYYLVNRWLAIC